MKQKISTLALLFVFLFSANSVSSQKDSTFNKKMYLGINGAYNLYSIFSNIETYNIDMEFERQFSKHWGYTAGLGVFHYMEEGDITGPDDSDWYYSSYVYLEMPIGMKFYSKIINLSIGLNAQLLLHKSYAGYIYNDYSPPNWMLGTYLTISKDFTVCRNFKMEPYIQGYWIFAPLLYNVPFPSVGLRLKYAFNNKQK